VTHHEFVNALALLGWTNKYAAHALGVHVTTVQRWRLGERQAPAAVACLLRVLCCYKVAREADDAAGFLEQVRLAIGDVRFDQT
jgi:DNA-binding transcriptional regulator YdaS (Cro superfamily)